MLSPYRSVLATPGALLWSAAGFLARMPISMVSLAIVLLVSGRTGEYSTAGVISAVYMLAAAASAPLIARLIDTVGQSRVLLPGLLVFAAALVLLTFAVESDWPTLVACCAAAVAGVGYPPIGACIRARWANALGTSPQLHTAYSLEAVLDEAVFIVGPITVTLLATGVDERLGVAAVLVFAVVGGLWLTGLRRTEPPVNRAGRRHPSARLDRSWLGLLVATAVCLGALFGATEVITVAFAQEHGNRGAAGPVLATWAAGSLIAGVITGSVHWRASALRRYRIGASAMALVMVPLLFVMSIPALAGVLFLAGFAISPTLVACVSLVQSEVPAARLTEGITWVMTGMGFGIAPGAAIAGRLIDVYGASTAYAVPVAAGVLAAVTAAVTPARAAGDRRARPPDWVQSEPEREAGCATSGSWG